MRPPTGDCELTARAKTQLAPLVRIAMSLDREQKTLQKNSETA